MNFPSLFPDIPQTTRCYKTRSVLQWNEENAVVCSHYQLKLIFTVIVCSLSVVYEIVDYILTLKQTHVVLRNVNYIQKTYS